MLDFAQLYEKHFMAVYRACLARFRQVDFAMEITQEGFARAFAHLGDLRDESKFLPWVIAIAMNFGIHKARHDTLEFNPLPPDELIEQAMFTVSYGDPQEQGTDVLKHWLSTLDASDRELFLLKYIYAVPNTVLCEKTHKSLSTVKRKLAAMRISLKEALDQDRKDSF